MTDLSGVLVLPGGLQPGRLSFGSDHRAGSALSRSRTARPVRYLLPGFIDSHVHGGDGGDTMDGAAGIETLARFHARHGTTTLLPTTITNPWAQVQGALEAVREVMARGVPGGADIVGAHLEGPFISPDKLGAQPPLTLSPTPDLVAQALETGVIRAVTLAPEVPGAAQAGWTLPAQACGSAWATPPPTPRRSAIF